MNLGLRAAASALGIHHATLLKAYRAGRVTRNDDQTFDVEACRALLKLNTNPTQQANSRKQQHRRPPEKADNRLVLPESGSSDRNPTDPSEPVEPEVAQSESYSEACRREKWIAVREREFKMRKLDGELVDLVAVNSFIAGMIIQARDTLHRLPAELRDRLAQETDPVEVERVLATNVEQVLRKLSEYRKAA